MNRKSIYIYNDEWFESTALENPLITDDHKLDNCYPKYYEVNYDVRLLATEENEIEDKINDYKQRYGTKYFNELIDYVIKKNPQTVLLNGFDQEQFDYIVDYLKVVKILYLFKCDKINDLSKLSNCSNLECLHIYWNNRLESLWNMSNNTNLKVLSFDHISKLSKIEDLVNTNIEYITFDSRNNIGQTKYQFSGNMNVFKEMKNLKHLKLHYKNIKVDY